MNDNFPKHILVFLGFVYLVACVAEIAFVKTGTELVFESVRNLVPHMAMFILGFYFSKKD